MGETDGNQPGINFWREIWGAKDGGGSNCAPSYEEHC